MRRIIIIINGIYPRMFTRLDSSRSPLNCYLSLQDTDHTSPPRYLNFLPDSFLLQLCCLALPALVRTADSRGGAGYCVGAHLCLRASQAPEDVFFT